jgi:hypothetical protein
MTVEQHIYLQEDEMIRRAVETLLRALGPVEATRFLALPRERSLGSVQRHRAWQDSLDQETFFQEVFGH